ncbi:hypothetical protein A9Q84_16035 [Halobacteriovorax marinus]|uniref:Probable membrane transporter protein n=1 Tax=Halobacteriovorax marinus TaxID=97084 RepID=A0A1Y5FA30_9BACT|nr:hypothetical protein A9Q84_16035 [Halobacteriovorax marinus]
MLIIVLICMIIGMIAGTLAGLFGIGGGLILVPSIIICLNIIQVPHQILMHMALGTSLSCILVNSSFSALTHYKKGKIDWKTFNKLIIGIILGVLFGGKIASALSSKTLEMIFASFLSLITLKMWLHLNIEPKPKKIATPIYWLVGLLIGLKSAVLGLGGGTISVPFLTWGGKTMKEAVGVSAFIGIPIALIGSLSYIYNGYGQNLLPEYSLGFVYLPAFLGIIITGPVFAKIGAHFSHSLPQKKLYRLFACFLTIILCKTLYDIVTTF